MFMNKPALITVAICLSAVVNCFAAENDKALERIRELSQKEVDYTVANQWMELSDEAYCANIRQDLLRIAASAMLYARKMDDYNKRIKSQLENVDRFEESLRSRCLTCDGNGRQYDACQHCHGSGRCQYAGCNHGYVEVRRRTIGSNLQPSTTYSAGSKKCSSCNGTGDCRYCQGEGRIAKTCIKCVGKGWIVTPGNVLDVYHSEIVAVQKKLEWIAEREAFSREREERNRREREEYEREASEMLALGLEYVDGKWMTPGSSRNVPYTIFQIYEPGHALCRDNRGVTFCLLYSAKDNRNIAEGDRMINDLYRCGVYSYTTVQNAHRTIRQYSIDLSVALKEIKRQNEQ